MINVWNNSSVKKFTSIYVIEYSAGKGSWSSTFNVFLIFPIFHSVPMKWKGTECLQLATFQIFAYNIPGEKVVDSQNNI